MMRRICSSADDAVARRGEVAENHVTALFAAEIQISPRTISSIT